MAVQLPKTIRQWFTPEQACKYLSQAFECDVELSDLDYFREKQILHCWVHVKDQRFSEQFFWFFQGDDFYLMKNPDPFINDFFNENKLPENSEVWTRAHIGKGEYLLERQIDEESVSIYLDGHTHLWYQCRKANASKIYPYNIPNELKGFSVSTHKNDTEIGYPRHELDRFIKAQTETPETQEPKKQSTWKTKAQSRADVLKRENPKFTKKQIAYQIKKEFIEQKVFDDRGKKSPDYGTIYKNIKIKTASRK